MEDIVISIVAACVNLFFFPQMGWIGCATTWL